MVLSVAAARPTVRTEHRLVNDSMFSPTSMWNSDGLFWVNISSRLSLFTALQHFPGSEEEAEEECFVSYLIEKNHSFIHLFRPLIKLSRSLPGNSFLLLVRWVPATFIFSNTTRCFESFVRGGAQQSLKMSVDRRHLMLRTIWLLQPAEKPKQWAERLMCAALRSV